MMLKQIYIRTEEGDKNNELLPHSKLKINNKQQQQQKH